jgi:four helix bundle protein
MKNFRCYQLALQFYKETRGLRLNSTLKEQLSRASSSVALNLAEGSARKTAKDQNRFFQISFASLRECQAIIELSELENTKAFQLSDTLAAHIYKLIQFHGG